MNVISFLSAVVQAGTPLLFATVGEIFSQKVGNLNLGLEGMMLMGAVTGFAVGYGTANPFLALMGAALAGMVGALVYAFITVTLKGNQEVTGLTLTIFGTGYASFVGSSYVGYKLPESVTSVFAKVSFPILSEIPVLGEIFFKQSPLVYLSYLSVLILGILLYKTKYGLNLKMVGENPAAADASGIGVSRYKYFYITLGGAMSGIGGAFLSLAYIPVWQENITAGKGWIAVALVIFAVWNPYRAVAGAYFFGGLDIIGFRLQKFALPVPIYIINMLPYVATILVLVLMSMKKSKENKAPSSIGRAYFREER
ncbi:ABC transporter permease [Alkalibacter saccharofermentans]|uniref:Nucleoside ABC transporter membrane protein n=1 Tax=Alkalibacter saccharofermentans DSM 14828 TaxID=1120975 RepID=A0A1M4VTY8_9FIRM|nr:ABC transporter permease [Alkalibacter saccharofermentans]SHE72504.1 nucleoside ABC transporter membrane protein [Alkalibacter saccharofermentans DSM 14828]